PAWPERRQELAPSPWHGPVSVPGPSPSLRSSALAFTQGPLEGLAPSPRDARSALRAAAEGPARRSGLGRRPVEPRKTTHTGFVERSLRSATPEARMRREKVIGPPWAGNPLASG